MKILQINCVYAYGSTGKIVEGITKHCLSKNDEVMVLYGRQGNSDLTNVIKVSSEFEAKIHSVLSRLTGIDFGYSPIATWKTIRTIKRFAPDIVHLHCLNGHFINVYHLIEYLKKQKIPTVLTLHAEIMHTAGCEHAYDCTKWIKGCHDCNRITGLITHYFRDDSKYAYQRMQRAFGGFSNLLIVGVSNWLTNRAMQSRVFKKSDAKFTTIENGLDLEAFHKIPIQENPISCKNNDSKPIILHVTPNFMHPLKGGKYVLELARKNPNWHFIIVGCNGDCSFPENVTAISHTQDKQELSWYYNIASITLLTSKRETFSMVCAESLACGTPIVGFEAGGPESVFKGDFVKFVEYGNIEALQNAVKEMLSTAPYVDTSLIRQRFSSTQMSETYRNYYYSISKK